jgi:hypothetical protein
LESSGSARRASEEQNLYGLNNVGEQAPSILRQIQTCYHPKQLEWVVSNLCMDASAPSTRTIRRWKRAISYKQKELGVRVMISDEHGGPQHGG